MARDFIILPEALADIRAAAQWYESQAEGLGKRFRATTKSFFRFLRKNPEAFAVEFDDYRCGLIRPFQYVAVF